MARQEAVPEREERRVARQRDEYGGINWGAAFFGWLVAIGLGALLTALLSAAGAAIALTEIQNVDDAISNADTVGIVGGILIIIVALIAYFAGGYVAGRMSRFDGPRQGVGVWIWSLAIAIVLAIVGAVAGSEYNLFADLDLPRIPIDEGDLTVGGVIVLVLVLIGTLLAAMAGGKAGTRYHRRVDAAGDAVSERPVATRSRDADRDTVDDRTARDRSQSLRKPTSTRE